MRTSNKLFLAQRRGDAEFFSNKFFSASLRLCARLLFWFSPLTLTAQEVFLVNATSVPEISIAADGQPLYPVFPQGGYTGGSATDRAAVVYQIKDLGGGGERALPVSFAPGSRQALVVHGDFSTAAGQSRRRGALPNVKLFTLDLAPKKDEPRLRYRLVNLVPNQTLRLSAKPEPVEIPSGQALTLSAQKPVVTLTVQAGGQVMPVLIHQRRVLRNCSVIFYETGAGISFVRFFEPNPAAAADDGPADE